MSKLPMSACFCFCKGADVFKLRVVLTVYRS